MSEIKVFKKDEYIVTSGAPLINGKKPDIISERILQGYVYKQRTSKHYLEPERDTAGHSFNGWKAYRIDNPTNWRYATLQEIKNYDKAKKPVKMEVVDQISEGFCITTTREDINKNFDLFKKECKANNIPYFDEMTLSWEFFGARVTDSGYSNYRSDRSWGEIYTSINDFLTDSRKDRWSVKNMFPKTGYYESTSESFINFLLSTERVLSIDRKPHNIGIAWNKTSFWFISSESKFKEYYDEFIMNFIFNNSFDSDMMSDAEMVDENEEARKQLSKLLKEDFCVDVGGKNFQQYAALAGSFRKAVINSGIIHDPDRVNYYLADNRGTSFNGVLNGENHRDNKTWSDNIMTLNEYVTSAKMARDYLKEQKVSKHAWRNNFSLNITSLSQLKAYHNICEKHHIPIFMYSEFDINIYVGVSGSIWTKNTRPWKEVITFNEFKYRLNEKDEVHRKDFRDKTRSEREEQSIQGRRKSVTIEERYTQDKERRFSPRERTQQVKSRRYS